MGNPQNLVEGNRRATENRQNRLARVLSLARRGPVNSGMFRRFGVTDRTGLRDLHALVDEGLLVIECGHQPCWFVLTPVGREQVAA